MWARVEAGWVVRVRGGGREDGGSDGIEADDREEMSETLATAWPRHRRRRYITPKGRGETWGKGKTFKYDGYVVVCESWGVYGRGRGCQVDGRPPGWFLVVDETRVSVSVTVFGTVKVSVFVSGGPCQGWVCGWSG